MHSLKVNNFYGSRGRSSAKKSKKISLNDKCYILNNLIPPEVIKYFKQCKASVNIDSYNHEHNTDIKSIIPYAEANDYLSELYNDYNLTYKFLDNYCNAEYQRLKRVRERVFEMVNFALQANWNMYFISNTFTDSALERTTEQSRRKAIIKWYEKVALEYVANIDYGTKNEREHYHGIVLVPNKIPKKLLSYWIKTYGGLKVKRVILTDISGTRLSKYITKLSAHAIKKSTKQNRVIYSRAFQRVSN